MKKRLFIVIFAALLVMSACSQTNTPASTTQTNIVQADLDDCLPDEKASVADRGDASNSGDLISYDALDDAGDFASLGDAKSAAFSGASDIAINSAFDAATGTADTFTESYSDIFIPYPDYDPIQAQAGTLTAGVWNDNVNFSFWQSLMGQRQDWKSINEQWGIYTTNRVLVRVLDSDGTPIPGAKVTLYKDNDVALWSNISNAKGEAVLFNAINTLNGSQPVKVVAEFNGVSAELSVTNTYTGASPLDITLDTQSAGFVNNLDIMFMIDTTGSMGDELDYITEELKDVVKRATEQTNKSIAVSPNFYRDEGDDYVVRAFNFSTNMDKVTDVLSQQHADGGGDYPEAVVEAMNSVLEHQWRSDSEKLLFLVLDAPAHYTQDNVNSLVASIQQMSEMGIRVIPVASSGVDTETEFLCRSFAIATGGEYAFLTDDSGVGYGHLEPTIGNYDIKTLNDLLVDIITDFATVEKRTDYDTEHPDINQVHEVPDNPVIDD